MTPARRIPRVLDEALGYNVYRCALLLRRQLVRALAGLKITPEQWQVLAVLSDSPDPVRQSDIVYTLMKDKPTVSRILKRMERDGWIRRASDERDSRVDHIAMTKAGARMAAAIPTRLARHFDQFFDRSLEDRFPGMIADLRQLQDALEGAARPGHRRRATRKATRVSKNTVTTTASRA